MRNWLATVLVMGFALPVAAQDEPPSGDPGAAPAGSEEMPPADTSWKGGMHAGVIVGGSKLMGTAADFFGFGFGGGLRAGYDIPMGSISIDPGATFMFNHYGAADPNPDALNLIIFNPGARIYYHTGGFDPFFDLQFGFGHGSMGGVSSNKMDIAFGAGADYWMSPQFGLGLLVDYGIWLTEGESTKLISFGLDTVYMF